MPRSNAAAMQETRRRLSAAAARDFRIDGFGAVGVDAIAKDAGVTSGAFYQHFGSKVEAFREALRSGLADLRNGLAATRAKNGDRWLRLFAGWYLNVERRQDLGQSCALAALTLDAARGDEATRDAYTTELRQIVAAMTAPGAGRLSEAEALGTLALLAGGLAMAHAVDDPSLGAKIARAVTAASTRVAPTQR